eukprot:1156506-Pelagomonas_calceolata.AAC.3
MSLNPSDPDLLTNNTQTTKPGKQLPYRRYKVTMEFDLQSGSLAARPAGLCQPQKNIHDRHG